MMRLPHRVFGLMEDLPRGQRPAVVRGSFALVRDDPIVQEAKVQPVSNLGVHEQALHPPSTAFVLVHKAARWRGKAIRVESWRSSMLDDEGESSHERDVILVSVSINPSQVCLWDHTYFHSLN